MNYICTWLCVDKKGEESAFPQTGELSSSQKHQNIYWRCILVFFITSKRFNKTEKHLLFTNVPTLPFVDGKSVADILKQLEVEIIYTTFNFKTPVNYFGSFQNQFYEFSILEYISNRNNNLLDTYLILDSDCVFLKPAEALFIEAKPNGFISFTDPVGADYEINGLSRNDLKKIYEELLNRKINEIPSYHLGEFFLSSVTNIKKIFEDFKVLWPELLKRNEHGLKKFNEEAHTLSFLYFKNGLKESDNSTFMRRIWTNPVFYRDVRPSDTNLCIWHLPAEKTFGIYALYDIFFNKTNDFGLKISDDDFTTIVQKTVNIPALSISMKMRYYQVSYSKALKKRMKKLQIFDKILSK